MTSIVTSKIGANHHDSVARVVMVQTHADFLNLPLATTENNRKGLAEAELYSHLETYVNYSLIDNDIAESWRLRRQAQESYEKLRAATEEIVHNVANSEGFLSHMFSHEVAPARSLSEVGQKLAKDLLSAGYSESNTATTLYTLASSGVAPIASLVSPLSSLNSIGTDDFESMYKLWSGSCRLITPQPGPKYEL